LPDFDQLVDQLVGAARSARQQAVAPYSGFAVGAAVLTTGGQIYAGVNIENASYSLTICAERVALFKALSEGARDFAGVAVVADTPMPTSPCGACRQVLWEHCGDVPVIAANLTSVLGRFSLAELLPAPFDRRVL
jgi:cytidine deaminase